MKEKLYNTLREHRQKKKLTQQKVTFLLGLKSSNRLSRWENGLAKPGLQNTLRLARIYQTKVEELYPQFPLKPPPIKKNP